MNASTGQIDFNRILRIVRQEFRIVELKELLNEYNYCGSRVLSKAQLQSKVEELLNSEKRIQVANSICLISRRLNGGSVKAPIQAQMVRTGAASSSYTTSRYQQHGSSSMGRPQAFGGGMPSTFNTAYYDASKVRYVPLPFYDIKEVLLPQIALAPSRNEGATVNTRLNFNIPREYLNKLSYRESDALPRYEIQMRMALCETDKEQPDAFPNNVKVMVNGALVTLPSLLNLQPQPGQPRPDQQKRVSRPVNLTPYCNFTRDQYQLSVDWQQDRHFFIVGVWITYHVNSQILRDRLKISGPMYYEETRALIQKNLGGGKHEDDGIAMDSLKISLVCPLSRVKMATPVRSKNCTHLQCFDLHNYLMMNEKRPSWKCPVCNKPCPYNVLVVDNYFAEIIGSKLTENVNEVELLTDGGWRIVEEKPTKKQAVTNVVGSSAPPSIVKAESVSSNNVGTPNASAPASAKPPQSAPDIITLDDSSDDEASEAPPSVASSSTKQPESRKRTYDQVSSSNEQPKSHQDLSVITIEDSDDEEDASSLPAPSTTNNTYPLGTNSEPSSALPLFDENKLFDATQNDFNTMDQASIANISMALLTFMQNLENDNRNCTT